MSKSELKRRCIQDPLTMAEEIDRLARLCEAKDAEIARQSSGWQQANHSVLERSLQLSNSNARVTELEKELAEQKGIVASYENQPPVAWINRDGTYVELSTKSTIYGSHTIPLIMQHEVAYPNNIANANTQHISDECPECLRKSVDAMQCQLSEAQAQIAMQAEQRYEIEGVIADMLDKEVFDKTCLRTLELVIENLSATSENVAAWRAKETESLRREVAMLREASIEYRSAQDGHFDGDSCRTAKDIELSNASDRRLEEADGRLCTVLNDTQATALAYEQEVENLGAVKALEVLLEEHRRFPHSGMIRIVEASLNELRAANKGEAK